MEEDNLRMMQSVLSPACMLMGKSSILCSSFAKFGIILFFGGVFRLAGQRRRGGGNIRTVNFGSIFLV
jgi:hypothetical protein